MVTNLIDNAVRHNIPEGRLDLATHTTAGQAVFTVANTGRVIRPSDIPRLFQPFHRLSRQANGVGLGLAIVEAIAHAHGASVNARARTGGGAHHRHPVLRAAW